MRTLFVILLATFCLSAGALEAQSLRGSQASLDRQNMMARQHDFTYIRTASQVRRFVEAGYLVPVTENRHLEIHQVSHPYARPEARVFIERLASQYHQACGEPLVVTSLTRPQNAQPRNASNRSVHPTGMAMDLRRSSNPSCRSWLEGVLLSLEKSGLLEATRERRPPHYHIALYPNPYRQYVEKITGRTVRVATVSAAEVRVKRGDSLWSLARKYGISVDAIQEANELRSARIYAGQTLKIPTGN